jgi:hypothetical protein
MLLTVKRTNFTEESTIGELFIDGKFFCYTLEDKDRGLTDSMSLAEIKLRKIFGVTCIPYGKYKVLLTMSPKFGKVLPLIEGVKGYDGIRIHTGNTAKDSLGCLLVGNKRVYNQLFESTNAMRDLMIKLSEVAEKEEITIEFIK